MVIKFFGLLCGLLLSFGAQAESPAVMPKVLAQENSLYHTIYVTEEDGLRCMRFSLVLPGRQSCVNPQQPQRLALVYAHAMLSALYVQPKPQHVLMIGLGGGSLPTAIRQLYPDADIESVEVDPVVASLAQRFFFFMPDAKQIVHEGDGRFFVRHALARPKRYDLIFLDAYDKNYIPEHMLTLNFMLELKGLLAAGGVLAANTASSGALYGYESATYTAAFGTFYNLKPQGRIVIAARDGVPPLATITQNAEVLDKVLQPFGVEKEKMLPLFISKPDWPADTPVLTDKYAPADLLNGQAARKP